MTLRPLAIALTAALASACATSDEPRLVSVPQAGVRPAMRIDQVDDYRTAAATISWIFDRDLGFPSFPATFRFYPHRDGFEKALLAVGYDAELARATARTMTAVGGHRGVLLNEGRFGLLPWPERVAMLAHELGHCLQYELGGGRRGASDQWLREGFADWLSFRVLERLDGIAMSEVRRERQRELRAAGRPKTPRFADLVTFPEWVRAGERHGQVMYAFAFLAADFLIERHGVPAVVDYFKRFATAEDRVGNFRAAFGEDIGAFETALTARLWQRR